MYINKTKYIIHEIQFSAMFNMNYKPELYNNKWE